MELSVFQKLNSVNVNEHTEEKNGLTYLSWAWAWAEVKKAYPNAQYTIYENVDGWNYFTDGRTCWVKTGVTIEGLEYIEYLPVMDYKNKSIPLEQVTSMDVNKTIQRSLTKACARHGLGLYVYAGEDLPEEEQKQVDNHPYTQELEQMLKGQTFITPDKFKATVLKKNNKQLSELTEEEWKAWKNWLFKKLQEHANEVHSNQDK
jgi:hypothetical protein